MRLTDVLTIIALVLGPIAALAIQRVLDRKREKDQRQRQVFRSLWATRLFPARLNYRHVEALSMIELEFEDSKPVLESWREYLDFLGRQAPDNEASKQQFYNDRNAKFIDLIFALSTYLRYRFTRLDIEKLTYAPVAHENWAQQETILREGVTRLFKGEFALPVAITDQRASQ